MAVASFEQIAGKIFDGAISFLALILQMRRRHISQPAHLLSVALFTDFWSETMRPGTPKPVFI
uniref:Uncharacterized protein n=1 Tax=Paracidobacterium acidisoli TaxID=2303751 RepID=A0A372ITJ5_9BACT